MKKINPGNHELKGGCLAHPRGHPSLQAIASITSRGKFSFEIEGINVQTKRWLNKKIAKNFQDLDVKFTSTPNREIPACASTIASKCSPDVLLILVSIFDSSSSAYPMPNHNNTIDNIDFSSR